MLHRSESNGKLLITKGLICIQNELPIFIYLHRLLLRKTYHLILLDVCSLYKSIPHPDDLKALIHSGQKEQLPHSTVAIICLRTFEYNSKNLVQISGVAMGTKISPSYVSL